MRTRAWGLLLVILILAAVVVTIMFVWRSSSTSAPPSSTPTITPTSPPVVPQPTDVPTQQATAAATQAPLVYTVQEGDTLSAIAQRYGISVNEIVAANDLPNPDVLSIGQAIVIPNHFVTPDATVPTEAPAPTALPAQSPTVSAPSIGPSVSLPTLTPSGPAVVEIGVVLGAGNLVTEVAVVRNRGGLANLEGWTLSDVEGNSFVFPALIVFDETEVRVHSAAGTSTPIDLYWGLTSPAWSSGELATLRDAAGTAVNTYIVP